MQVSIRPSDLKSRAAVDLKRVKDPASFRRGGGPACFRIEPDKFAIAVAWQWNDGLGLRGHESHAEGGFVLRPAPRRTSRRWQECRLLAGGIYPERIELSSVATLGALADYLAFKKSKTPTLVLEIGGDTTYTYIVTSAGVEAARPILQGLDSMIPVVQKELNLKDEESAKRLFLFRQHLRFCR